MNTKQARLNLLDAWKNNELFLKQVLAMTDEQAKKEGMKKFWMSQADIKEKLFEVLEEEERQQKIKEAALQTGIIVGGITAVVLVIRQIERFRK